MISINISELIWTVINFFLLLFLLNRFLYKPVISFMEQRQARIDAKLREEEEAKARIEENDARILDEKARSREEESKSTTRKCCRRQKKPRCRTGKIRKRHFLRDRKRLRSSFMRLRRSLRPCWRRSS